MAPRRPRTAVATLPLWQEPERGIRPHAAGERLKTLLEKRERLLRDVQKKKLAIEQFSIRMLESARTMQEKLAPLIAKHEALSAELSVMFGELLAPGRLSKTARKKVTRVLRALQSQGVLDTQPFPFEGEGEGDAPPFTSDTDSEPPWVSDPPPIGHAPREQASAPQRGQGASRESLRALFRRLALSVHPDHAEHESERDRRTEAMKQVTQAYEEGDLARLLELEKAWKSDQIPTEADNEARCRELERMIRELRKQADTLRLELRRLQQSTPLTLLESSTDELIAEAETELKEVETIRDFVLSFRDGKITLARFVEGPDVGHEDELELDGIDFYELMEQAAMRANAGLKRKQARARKS